MAKKIEVVDLSKTFWRKEQGGLVPVEALKDVNLGVDDREFYSFVGPSGCGKTTLLRILAGLISSDKGETLISGKPILRPGPDRAMVFQSLNLFPWRDAVSNVMFGLEIQGAAKKERRESAKKYIELVGLKGFEHHYPHELSGGMQQRIGLARALAINPEILLCDEPFGALDAQTRELMGMELLKIWHKTQKTVVFVTHDIDEAVYLSDRVAIFTARPGRPMEIVDVELPRPRYEYDVKAEPYFVKTRSYIWGKLKDAILRSHS